MKINRAYTLLTVKSVSEDERVIRGMASTPAPDRVGDIVEPMGAKFQNPAPLLWMHDHSLPVGTVIFSKATKEGIPFEARLPQVENPSQLKARIDEAWESVKAGLIRAVSIGFRALEWSVMEDTGGYRFTSTEILELSLVSVPANAGATITEIKAYDAEILKAASGKNGNSSSDEKRPGVSGKKANTVKLTPKEGKKMNLKEQIKSFQAERAAKVAQMEEIMTKAGEAGETLAADQEETYDALQSEVEKIDKHLVRLGNMEKAQSSTTKAIGATEVKGENAEDATTSRNPSQPLRVKPKLEKGIAFARIARIKALSKMENMTTLSIAESLYPNDGAFAEIFKTAIPAANTTNATWAKPLVDTGGPFADFVEFLRPQTILGKFGEGGVPSLRRIPFRTRLIGQTSGAQGYWVGEGAAKPVTKFDLAGTSLDPLKVANIAVATMELIRDSSPSADALIRDELARALKERLDIDFIDPAKTASAGISPASITNGVTPIPSSGSDADAIRCDIEALYGAFIAANNAPTSGVFIMSSVTALALSQMRNPLGQKEFPGVNFLTGGTLEELPVIVSEYVPTDTDGGYVFLVNAQDIYFADEGGIQVDMSQEASLQMLDNPTNNAVGSTVPTTTVSLWQTNCVGFRAERTVNWSKRRPTAVAVLSGVAWGSCAT